MQKPLEGIRIVDLTAYLSGPYATKILAALGAEVIKIERPGVGDPCRWNPPYAGPHGINFDMKSDDDISLLYLKRNRNKKSIFLDMKNDEGCDILKKLIAKSAVLIENFSYGAMERLGLDYQRVKDINPEIIYCSISGYGHSGPYKNRTAFDLTIQAMSGIMSLTGYPDKEPLRCGAWIGDMASSLYSVIGILSALKVRDERGVGCKIDISMQDACFSLVTDEAHDYNIELGLPTRTGNRLARLAPWNAFSAKDGYVIICVANNNQWQNLLDAMERDDLKTDERLQDQQGRYKNSDHVEYIVNEWMKNLNREDALRKLREKNVPCDPVPEFYEVLQDEQLKFRGMIQNVYHAKSGDTGLKAAGLPIKFSNIECRIDKPAPMPGGNVEILQEIIGLSAEEIVELKKKGVLG